MEPPNIISNHQIIHSCPFSTAWWLEGSLQTNNR
jgi:hypothetical protein